MNLELTSIEFVFLLPFVILVYYTVPRRMQKFYLLLINLLFYASFGYKYIAVILVEAIVVWLASRYFDKNAEKPRNCTFCLIGSLLILIVILLFFKLGSVVINSIVAPLGISFYTLQAISYLVDVKKGEIPSEKNLVKMITYLSFFPTITSGPIFRYKDFYIEYNRNANGVRPEYDRIINGILYMLYGYFLKLVISARTAVAVDKVFGDYSGNDYGGIILAIVAALYSIQIFTDFAGYSAIVIGVAQILGYRIPENFVAPYLSMNVKEFWGRWHISFSSWLKDYIYIPLGGNRKGRLRKYLNIMITFIVSGIWHGVSGWHFLIWGGLHGIYQIAGDITRPFRERHLNNIGIIKDTWFHRTLKRVITFILVTIAWVFFRTGIKDAIGYLSRVIKSWGMIQITNGGLLSIGLSARDWTVLAVALVIVIVVDCCQYRKKLRFDELVSSQGTLAKCMTFVIISLTILIWGIYGDQHDASYFIYRDF